MLASIHADAKIVGELGARPVLDDPTFHLQWSFEERSKRFVDMLHAPVDGELNADDRVLITVSTQLEAHALTRWLQQLSARQKPWIVILFLSDRWNRAGRDEYERQAAEFLVLSKELSSVSPGDVDRLIFCASNRPLAEELSGLLGTSVATAPFTLEYRDAALCDSPEPGARLPRVAVLGGTRRDKGPF